MGHRASEPAVQVRRVRILSTPRTIVALIAVVLLALCLAIAWHLRAPGDGVTITATSSAPAPHVPLEAESPAAASAVVVVYVTGEVQTPGVYELKPTDRVGAAVAAAGGLLETADPAAQNLARVLADGEHIHVPKRGEAPAPAASGPAGAPGGGPIDVNQASAEQLQDIPGIGPALAGRIIDYRETNGPYASVDELDDVPGIGPALLERLRDGVRVG